jgi:uncharacterized membrane protein YgdD (TMEM256/DUF423 family)
MRKPVNILFISAFFGFTGVALGAFGAHALKATLAARGTHDIWETGILYHLVHSAALLGLAATVILSAGRTAGNSWLFRAAWCWAAGILLFSGSLYGLALGGPGKLLGPITPLGGLAFLAGWSCVMIHAFSQARKESSTDSS